MINASQYAETETLRTGLKICFRASRPDDVDRLVEAFNKLDPESLYLRFFGPKKEISALEMQRFKETDFKNRVILFCTVMQDDREIIIGSGSYVRIGADDAEVAAALKGVPDLILFETLPSMAECEAVAALAAEVGDVDLLVNNAGYAVFGTQEEVPLDVVRDLLALLRPAPQNSLHD